MSFFDRVGSALEDLLLTFGPKLIYAVIVTIAGFLIAKLVKKIVTRFLNRIALDLSLKIFLIKTCDYLFKILILISAITMLGIPTTSLIAALSAVAVGVSLALKDSLGNIAGGIMLLLTHPFSTGDVVGINNYVGTVKFVDLIHTTVVTFDNVNIIIPNGKLINETILNYSRQDLRRLDLTFSIGRNDDFNKAKQVILGVIKANDMVLSEPAPPFVRVAEHSQSSTVIEVKVWCKNSNYINLRYDLIEKIKLSLDKAGIVIPYQQLDVHILNNQ